MTMQTRFDLNAAIENWRHELAAQPNLASDDRRELETHLRDAVTGFQQRGLNDEESFWLARRRVGQPQQLGEEFEKANPARVWRDRAFWVVLFLPVFRWWNLTCPNLLKIVLQPEFNVVNPHDPFHTPATSWHSHVFSFLMYDHGVLLSIVFPTLVYLLPLFCFIILFAQGRMNWVDRVFRFIIRSRLQFLLMGLALVLVFHYYDDSVGRLTIVPQSSLFFQYCTDVLLTKSWPLTLIVLITWLMPTQKRKTPKRA